MNVSAAEFSIYLGLDDDDTEIMGLSWTFSADNGGVEGDLTLRCSIGSESHEEIISKAESMLESLQEAGIQMTPTRPYFKALRSYKKMFANRVRAGKLRGVTKKLSFQRLDNGFTEWLEDA